MTALASRLRRCMLVAAGFGLAAIATCRYRTEDGVLQIAYVGVLLVCAALIAHRPRPELALSSAMVAAPGALAALILSCKGPANVNLELFGAFTLTFFPVTFMIAYKGTRRVMPSAKVVS